MPTNFLSLVLVFAGGGMGSVFRYGIGVWLAPYQATFPYATLLANVLSCAILGFVMGLGSAISSAHRLLVAVGFCGGFSTFSTFSNDSILLFQRGAYALVFANVLLNLIICTAAILGGAMLAKWWQTAG